MKMCRRAGTRPSRQHSKKMNDLEYQERIAKMTVAELIDGIVKLTEDYNSRLTMLTHEILIRSMQQAE